MPLRYGLDFCKSKVGYCHQSVESTVGYCTVLLQLSNLVVKSDHLIEVVACVSGRLPFTCTNCLQAYKMTIDSTFIVIIFLKMPLNLAPFQVCTEQSSSYLTY